MKKNKFRELKTKELELLKTYYQNVCQDKDAAHNILQKYWFTAIDTPHFDSSMYNGTVIVAVYGMIEFYEMFHIEHNTIKRILMYDLNLNQSMQLTSILHMAITQYMHRLGFVRKPRQNQEKI
jgi:hypothetical protein